MTEAAVRIFKKLICSDGHIDDTHDQEMFFDYKNPTIREEIDILARELDFYLLELPHKVYLIPTLDNYMVGYTPKDIRTSIRASANLRDAYLRNYIIMVILYMFYGGKNTNPKNTEFIQINDIISEIDKRFELVDTSETQKKYSIDFKEIKNLWMNKPVYEEGGKTSSRYAQVFSACRFLEYQKLIVIADDNTEIRSLPYLDDVMINYYLLEDRIKEINEMFEEEEKSCQK